VLARQFRAALMLQPKTKQPERQPRLSLPQQPVRRETNRSSSACPRDKIHGCKEGHSRNRSELFGQSDVFVEVRRHDLEIGPRAAIRAMRCRDRLLIPVVRC
jgi:hypothetical protein